MMNGGPINSRLRLFLDWHTPWINHGHVEQLLAIESSQSGPRRAVVPVAVPLQHEPCDPCGHDISENFVSLFSTVPPAEIVGEVLVETVEFALKGKKEENSSSLRPLDLLPGFQAGTHHQVEHSFMRPELSFRSLVSVRIEIAVFIETVSIHNGKDDYAGKSETQRADREERIIALHVEREIHERRGNHDVVELRPISRRVELKTNTWYKLEKLLTIHENGKRFSGKRIRSLISLNNNGVSRPYDLRSAQATSRCLGLFSGWWHSLRGQGVHSPSSYPSSPHRTRHR